MSDQYLNIDFLPEERAKALLEELSIDEKMAQVRGFSLLEKAGTILTPSQSRLNAALAR